MMAPTMAFRVICLRRAELKSRPLHSSTNASGGFLVVIDPWQENDEQTALGLSADDLPVAVIDGRSWRSLQRLGSASPPADSRSVFETVAPELPEANPLHELAAQKWHSAQVLLAQQCTVGVMDLLASALLSKLAALHGQLQAPAITEAAIWLYTEIVPRGGLSSEQTAQLLQLVVLSLGSNVPETLTRQAADAAEPLWQALGGSPGIGA